MLRDFESLFEEVKVIASEPFPGAAPPFGSKDEDDDESESDETATTGESLVSQLCWGTFALDALDDTMTDDPKEHDAAIDHSKGDEPHDTSTAGFASAARLVVGQEGITSPVSKLPQAPPGAADRAKERQKAGRGVEGGDEGIDPMSTMDKFNWDHLPLPGMGQI